MTDGELGVALAVLRVVRGWSQHDLAEASGVRASSISNYERAKTLPEMRTLSRIVAAMGYPLSALDEARTFVYSVRMQSALKAGAAPLAPASGRSAPSPAALYGATAAEAPASVTDAMPSLGSRQAGREDQAETADPSTRAERDDQQSGGRTLDRRPASPAELENPAALHWELEQVSAEAGRVVSRVARVILHLLYQSGHLRRSEPDPEREKGRPET